MKRDIAIIGMSGKFPKSDTVREFWNNLVDEKELVHFFSDEELKARGIEKKEFEDPQFIKAVAYVNDPEHFDYPFFKYTPDEATIMNPQTRMMHQLVWQALEDAGCDIERYKKKVGIFLGANKDLNWSMHSMLAKNETVDALLKGKMSNPNFMASLISYKLNLKGPCYFLDTACSTSLSTVHLACRSLLLNECGSAVVGGIRLLSFDHNGYQHHQGSIFSKDGHTKSFDADSSGTVFSDGAGVVILKRLEEAIQDKDHIYAVIKATAMNNDGNAKAGYTMPSVQGQTECIKLAQKIAGVTPEDITYVETHGTGTRIGDPIEIESLHLAFRNNKKHSCAIGSVKSNMGHADEAAGITGLIKTSLALKHKTIPASLHFNKPNPSINFEEGPFYVNSSTTTWETRDDKPRTAGVSSFGIGGTNLHAILQEAPVLDDNSPEPAYKLIQFSAQSQESLEAYQSSLLEFAENMEPSNLNGLAYTLQVGRKRFDYGKTLVVSDSSELIETLRSKSTIVEDLQEKDQIVFMFSGQGSQYLNMGKGLYDEYPFFKKTLDEGFDLLKRISNIDFKEFLFGTDSESAEINNTRYTQPILFLFEYALAKWFIELEMKPDVMIGHSLGEYVAACIAGVFNLEDALKIVNKRAELMSTVESGDMVGVGMALSEIDPELYQGVSVAAINSPGSFVLTGSTPEMDKVREKLVANEITHVDLKTSHAFHSKMMEEILEAFGEELETIEMMDPSIPFISNISGNYISPDEATSVSYWKEQIVATVDFEKGIKRLIDQGHSLFIEVGPGKTLTTFFKQSNKKSLQNAVLTTVRHPKEEVDDRFYFTNFLGKLGSYGMRINWDAYYNSLPPLKISAPVYNFDPYEIEARVSIKEQIGSNGILPNEEKNLEDCFYVPSWKYVPDAVNTKERSKPGSRQLFFADDSHLCETLKNELITSGIEILEIRKGAEFEIAADNLLIVNPDRLEDFEKMGDYISTNNFQYDSILYAWDVTSTAPKSTELTNYRAFQQTFNAVLNIAQSLDLNSLNSKLDFVLLSCNNYVVLGSELPITYCNHAATLLQILAQESPNLNVSHIDLDTAEGHFASSIIKEIARDSKFSKVAFRNKKRWLPFYQPLPAETVSTSTTIQTKGNYIITGNFDIIGHTLAYYLASHFSANVFILDAEAPQKINELDTNDQNLSGQKTITVMDCDITDRVQLASVIEDIQSTHGKINGIIHSARDISANELTLVSQSQPEVIEKHFSIKVDGLLAIDSVFATMEPDFISVISSLASFLGGVFYGAYAAASTLMDDLVLHRMQTKTNWSVLNLDRIGADEEWIQKEELVSVFERSFAFEDLTQLVISRRDLEADLFQNNKKEPAKVAKATLNRKNLKSSFQAPQSDTEMRVIGLFESLFGMEGIGVEDDFFDLGGDSLKGIPLINKINKEFSIQISLTDFFNNPTVVLLASLIDNRKWLASKPQTKNEILI